MQVETPIVRWDDGVASERLDCVAMEAPLEIGVNGESLAVTMRTPGDDFALTMGFLYAESIIRNGWDVATMGYYGTPGDPDWQNIVHVTLRAAEAQERMRTRLQRNFLASSSCGVCGKASLEAANCAADPIPETGFRVSANIFPQLNARLRAAQQTFDRTGGLHAAGLFNGEGELLSLCEDVGRHNAVDKLVGREVQGGRLPLTDRILMVSGRTSFEILQKAAMARFPVVCAVSAPSSLAVELARRLNITLIGFLRGSTMNVYAGNERILS
jgi:FdhD protein